MIDLENCENVTVVDSNGEVIAVVSHFQIIEKKGYKVLFDVGEN